MERKCLGAAACAGVPNVMGTISDATGCYACLGRLLSRRLTRPASGSVRLLRLRPVARTIAVDRRIGILCECSCVCVEPPAKRGDCVAIPAGGSPPDGSAFGHRRLGSSGHCSGCAVRWMGVVGARADCCCSRSVDLSAVAGSSSSNCGGLAVVSRNTRAPSVNRRMGGCRSQIWRALGAGSLPRLSR